MHKLANFLTIAAAGLLASGCTKVLSTEEQQAAMGVQFVPVATIASAHDCGYGEDQPKVEFFVGIARLREHLKGRRPELALPSLPKDSRLALLTFGKFQDGGHHWQVHPKGAISKGGLLVLNVRHVEPNQDRFALKLKTRPCTVVLLPEDRPATETTPAVTYKKITGIGVWDEDERFLASTTIR